MNTLSHSGSSPLCLALIGGAGHNARRHAEPWLSRLLGKLDAVGFDLKFLPVRPINLRRVLVRTAEDLAQYVCALRPDMVPIE